MKKLILILVSILLVFTLCACNKGEDASSNPVSENGDGEKSAITLDIVAEADAIIQKYNISGGTRFTSTSKELGKYLDDNLILSYYGDITSVPDFKSVEAYEVYIDETKPLDPCEFGIFKMKSGADAETFVKFLKNRINIKIENSKAYPTMDTTALKTAEFTIKGSYVWYCVVKGGNEEINKTLEGKFN